MTNFDNPYEKGVVRTSDKFYGFKAQQKEMKKHVELSISSKCKHFTFVGEPSSGKSSFLNITKEFSNNKGFLPISVKLKLEIKVYDLYYEIFYAILNSFKQVFNSRPEKAALINFQKAINTGEGECDFQFPFQYYNWSKRGNRSDDFPSRSLILNDFCELIRLYNKIDKRDDSNGKIAIVFDDFQQIIGCDEHGEIKNKSKKNELIASADEICDSLRELVDDHDDQLSDACLFIFATYPNLVDQIKYEKQHKLLARRCEPIFLDKYDSIEETEELITQSLSILPNDHPWKIVYYDKDDEAIKNKINSKNNFYEANYSFIPLLIDSEINGLTKHVHKVSNGRPFGIKLQMAEIFNLCNDFLIYEDDHQIFFPFIFEINPPASLRTKSGAAISQSRGFISFTNKSASFSAILQIFKLILPHS